MGTTGIIRKLIRIGSGKRGESLLDGVPSPPVGHIGVAVEMVPKDPQSHLLVVGKDRKNIGNIVVGMYLLGNRPTVGIPP